jgi:hypothetical protein
MTSQVFFEDSMSMLLNLRNNADFMSREQVDHTVRNIELSIRQMVLAQEREIIEVDALLLDFQNEDNVQVQDVVVLHQDVVQDQDVVVQDVQDVQDVVVLDQDVVVLDQDVVVQDEDPLQNLIQRFGIRAVRMNRYCRSLSMTKYNAVCKEPCSICFETHIKGESLETLCGHEFGKECYEQWINSANGNRCCPTCRKQTPFTIVWRIRKTKKNVLNNV